VLNRGEKALGALYPDEQNHQLFSVQMIFGEKKTLKNTDNSEEYDGMKLRSGIVVNIVDGDTVEEEQAARFVSSVFPFIVLERTSEETFPSSRLDCLVKKRRCRPELLLHRHILFNKLSRSNGDIREAVRLWCADQPDPACCGRGEERCGHISKWDVSRGTNMMFVSI